MSSKNDSATACSRQNLASSVLWASTVLLHYSGITLRGSNSLETR